MLLAFIAGATFVYLKLIVAWFGDNNLNSITWCKRNQRKLVWTVGTPNVYVHAPALEELIFRVPIIIAFSVVLSIAWYGIFISGGLFALAHWSGNKTLFLEVLSHREKGKLKSDNMEAEMNRLYANKKYMLILGKVFNIVVTFFLGILAGYYGIKYQSVWVAFGIHSVWNIVMPILIALLMVFVVWISLPILWLWDKVS